MANVSLGFQLSASAAGMSQGINAGVVELQKLGFAAKRSAADLSTLKTLQISQLFISSVRAVTSGFQQFTAGAASAIDQTAKLGRAIGLSFEELQQLNLAATLSGASTEQLAQAFRRAQLTIAQAEQGSKTAVDALGRLGISITELAGLSAAEQFQRIAEAVAGIDSPTRRTAAAVAVFGEEGARLLPVFQDLSTNLRDAETFFGAFQTRLTGTDARAIESINDAFTRVRTATLEVTGALLARLEPALTRAARSVQEFLQGVNIDRVADQAAEALRRFAAAGELLSQVAGVALQRPLVAIGVALAFINRQALLTAFAGLAQSLVAAATAASGFSVAATAAAVGATTLKIALRGLASATIIGAVGVAFSIAAERALQFFDTTTNVAENVPAQVQEVANAIGQVQQQFTDAGNAATEFGRRAEAGLKVPVLTAADVAQSAVSDAQSAVRSLAREFGGLSQVPTDVVLAFADIVRQAQLANVAVVDQTRLYEQVQRSADRFTQQLRQQLDLQKQNADAARQTAEQVRQAGQQAQRRTQELAQQGLSGADQSRLQLNRDLATLSLEQANAERALGAAIAQRDDAAIVAARERLRLVRLAVVEAQEQDRERRLDALGISRSLLEPVKTVRDQIIEVRRAFDQGLINPEQLRNALVNLADEGLRIRQEIDRELSTPSSQALRIADIRSSEGLSQFLQSQRRDPAIDQRAQQLAELREIRDALLAARIRPVDILGGA